jgi:hypothetical protein
MALYRHNEGIWTKRRAVNYGRLRFESTGIIKTEPRHITNKADGTQHRRQIELRKIHAVQPHEPEGGNDPADSIYTSDIRYCFHALPKQVRRLVGNIPEFTLPEKFDCRETTDLIVATDRSVLFGVGYHSWISRGKTSTHYYTEEGLTMELHCTWHHIDQNLGVFAQGWH